MLVLFVLRHSLQVLLSDGKYGIIQKVRSITYDEPQTTHNFEVQDYHTYYVGEQSVCVHNAAPCGKNFSKNQQAVIDLAKDAKRTGISSTNAETLSGWANEYGVKPVLNHGPHLGTQIDFPHIRIGKINHIRIK